MANGCKSMPDKLPFGTLPVKENCMAVWSADLSVRGGFPGRQPPIIALAVYFTPCFIQRKTGRGKYKFWVRPFAKRHRNSHLNCSRAWSAIRPAEISPRHKDWPAMKQSVRFSAMHRHGATKLRCGPPTGIHSWSPLYWRKTVSVGTPSATARCSTPESAPICKRHRCRIAANCAISGPSTHRKRLSPTPLASAVRRSRSRGLALAVATNWIVGSAPNSRLANSIQWSSGHSLTGALALMERWMDLAGTVACAH